jgi:hypothetical protein
MPIADTTLAQAFQDAGFVPAAERLREAALRALASSPRSWDGAKDALYNAVRSDAALLWELFAPYRSQAAQSLLSGIAAEMRESERARQHLADPSAPGHKDDDDRVTIARRAEMQNSSGWGPSTCGDQRPSAPSARGRAGMEAVAAVTRLSLLDTFRVNGQPIGKVTSIEAMKWAGARERDARFVRLLTANLPPNRPIGEFRTPEDTQAIYELAVRETANAE